MEFNKIFLREKLWEISYRERERNCLNFQFLYDLKGPSELISVSFKMLLKDLFRNLR